jgi:hypothetical protein
MKFKTGDKVRFNSRYLNTKVRNNVSRDRIGTILYESNNGLYRIEWPGRSTPSYHAELFLELASEQETREIVKGDNFSFATFKPSIDQSDLVYMEKYYRQLYKFRDSLYTEEMRQSTKMDLVEKVTNELQSILDWIIGYEINHKAA